MPQQVSHAGVRWVTGLAIASLVAAFALLLTPSDGSDVRSREADGYSRSALGHHGLIALLKELGEPVTQRRSVRARDAGVLVIAEPDPAELAGVEDSLVDRVDAADRTLVVLPKRRELVAPPSAPVVGPGDDARWIDGAELLSIEDVEDVVAGLPLEYHRTLSVRRVDAGTAWRTFAGLPAPDVAAPLQLLERQDHLDALIECREGVLLGFVDGVYVLSDPDVIENHGLARGDNAALIVGLLRHLNESRGAIVFDETVHGHVREPDIFTVAGTFPAVLVSVHLLLFFALVAFAGRGRFGAPVAPPPAIGGGKAFLIDNVAALLRRGGHHGHSLRRYARLRVREAAARLHAPPGLDDEQLAEWLLARVPDRAAADELRALLATRYSSLSPEQTIEHAARIRERTETIHHAT